MYCSKATNKMYQLFKHKVIEILYFKSKFKYKNTLAVDYNQSLIGSKLQLVENKTRRPEKIKVCLIMKNKIKKNSF